MLKKINEILDWAETSSFASKIAFDDSFVQKMKVIAVNGELTDNQEAAIEKIYSRFKIDEWDGK